MILHVHYSQQCVVIDAAGMASVPKLWKAIPQATDVSVMLANPAPNVKQVCKQTCVLYKVYKQLHYPTKNSIHLPMCNSRSVQGGMHQPGKLCASHTKRTTSS